MIIPIPNRNRHISNFDLQHWTPVGITNRGAVPGSAGVSPAIFAFGSQLAGGMPAFPGSFVGRIEKW